MVHVRHYIVNRCCLADSVAVSEELPKKVLSRPKTRRQFRLEATDESEMPEYHSSSEEDDCYYWTNIKHWLDQNKSPNTAKYRPSVRLRYSGNLVPSKVKQPKETSQDTGPPDNVHPAPVNLEEKKEYFITRELEREKSNFSKRRAAETCLVELTLARVENFPGLRDMKQGELTPSEAGEPQPLRNDTSTELIPSRLKSSLR